VTTWGDIRRTVEAAGYRFDDEPSPARMTREEYNAEFPRVRVYMGKAYHIYGWEAGIMWGRVPFGEAEEGGLAYRRQIGIEVRAGLLRYLRGVFRIVRN
jgi:hypothetical protein